MTFLIYLILTLATGFVAGIFRYHPLVVLFVAEIVLGILVLVLGFLSSFFISISPRGRMWSVEKGKESFGSLDFKNGFPFPISRILVKGLSSYGDGTLKKKLRLSDSLSRGTTRVDIPISGPFSGKQVLNITGLKLWDMFGFFFFPKKQSITVPIAVLPTRESLSLEFSNATLSTINSEKLNINDPTRDRDEFRQLRDYSYGDPWRDVDWHKSAKADKLVVREYDREAETFLDILLEGDGYRAAGTKKLDAFYSLLSALIRGIRETGTVPRISWLEGNGNIYCREEIRGEEDMEVFFLKLYEEEIYDPSFSGRKDSGNSPAPKSILTLNPELVLSSNGRILKEFHQEELQDEIEASLIVI